MKEAVAKAWCSPESVGVEGLGETYSKRFLSPTRCGKRLVYFYSPFFSSLGSLIFLFLPSPLFHVSGQGLLPRLSHLYSCAAVQFYVLCTERGMNKVFKCPGRRCQKRNRLGKCPHYVSALQIRFVGLRTRLGLDGSPSHSSFMAGGSGSCLTIAPPIKLSSPPSLTSSGCHLPKVPRPRSQSSGPMIVWP